MGPLKGLRVLAHHQLRDPSEMVRLGFQSFIGRWMVFLKLEADFSTPFSTVSLCLYGGVKLTRSHRSVFFFVFFWHKFIYKLGVESVEPGLCHG